jgi:tRNA-splicing endonuclease subunit Sen54
MASIASLFQALRGVAAPAGHNAPLNHASDTESPYKVFFNLYKPPTPFKKTAPPEPDFEVVVIKCASS